MAQVRIESIVDHLSYDMKRALEDAISQVLPGANIDRNELYRAFRRAVGRKCSTWPNVSDSHVMKTCQFCGKNT